MQEVNIYIDVHFKGRLNCGTGTYSIVLEYIKDNIPYTKECIGGYKNTTRNRTAILACIEAIEYLIRPCAINLIINSKFVYQAIKQEWYRIWIRSNKNAKGEKPNNIDLWLFFVELIKDHELKIEYQTTNSYSSYMKSVVSKSNIVLKEDNQNVV